MVDQISNRPISWPLYLIAFIISATLFAMGIFIGNSLAKQVDSELQNELNVLKMRTAEMELLTLIGESEDQCLFYKTQFESFNRDTTKFGSDLGELEKARNEGDAPLRNLKREFQLMQARDFLLTQKMNEKCKEQTNTVLFFYTNTDCSECTKQGRVGPELKNAKQDVMIYAFDADLDSPVVEALRIKYGVSKYPTLVINGKKFEGFQSQADILKEFER